MKRRRLLSSGLAIAGAAGAMLPAAMPAGASALSAGPRPSQPVKLDPRLKVHPYLQYGAQADPERRVRVLVMRSNTRVSRTDMEAVARGAGGRWLEDFRFLHTSVMEVPLKAVLAMAKHAHVRYVGYDGPVRKTAIDASQLRTAYPATMDVPAVWNGSAAATGRGVTVAVIDSGVTDHADLGGDVIKIKASDAPDALDQSGHGTHVIGTIKGRDSQGRYIGVAPDARVISVKVTGSDGGARESDVLRGLQWVLENRGTYNIRAVNVSINGAVATSYTQSLVSAAVEQLWFSGIVVVTSAGNRGTASDATWYGPGNDPYVVTVGALDDAGTAGLSDNSLATFSSRGLTQDNFAKPEVVAPGRRIVSTLAPGTTLAQKVERIVDGSYLRLSGTSMSAPIVTGLVALLLERYPNLTPDQIKWLLMNSATSYPGKVDGAGAVNAAALIAAAGGAIGTANQGLTPAQGSDPANGTLTFGSSNYWESNYWESNYWESNYWESNYWESATTFDSYYWDDEPEDEAPEE